MDTTCLNTISEEDLLRACLGGERKSWDELITRYSGVIYRVIKTFRLSRQEEADIYQQIFLELYKDNHRKLKSFQGKCSFSTWISVVTRRYCINYLRDKKQRFKLITDIDPEKINAKEDEPFSKVETDLLIEKLIAELSSKDRLILKLYYLKGLSCKEISDITETTLNTVYSKINRALEKMRRSLGN